MEVGTEESRGGPGGLFRFSALVSINLAVFNALPLPALDGGYMALLVRPCLAATAIRVFLMGAPRSV